MKVIILAISQKFKDENLIIATLSKLRSTYPDALIRFAAPCSGASKRARDHAQEIGFKTEEWRSNGAWTKYNSDIRCTEMITGVVYEPDTPLCDVCRWPHPTEEHPPADLLIAFHAGGNDNAKDLIAKYLIVGKHPKPIVVYREKWTKRRRQEDVYAGLERAENNKQKRWLLGKWRKA